MVGDGPEVSHDYDMQLIGSFLSCASRGDKVGLNQMLRKGISPDVQDYDNRTALHLAASEGHASIVELLLEYKASVNLEDRWQRTPLTDAKLYGHRDICRILEVNGGRDSNEDHPLVKDKSRNVALFCKAGNMPSTGKKPDKSRTFPHEQGLNEVNIDLSELNLEQSLAIDQGVYGASEKVKWRGTWVVKTIIQTDMKLSAKEMSLLRELRHPNILQFLGAIVHGEEMILITEYLSKGSLYDILDKKVRFDILTSVRYALDIARKTVVAPAPRKDYTDALPSMFSAGFRRKPLPGSTRSCHVLGGMNYLHQHKPDPIVHNNLCSRNLLQDEAGHLKIGEYWVQMLYEKMHPYQENPCLQEENLVNCQRNDSSVIICNSLYDTKNDIYSFALIFYEMLEGGASFHAMNFDRKHLKSINFVPKFKLSRCPLRIQQLIRDCLNQDHPRRPTFAVVIEILEEVSMCLGRPGCPVC